MDQLITDTNRALQRLRSARTAAEAEAARKELVEEHLPQFALLDSEHHAYGEHFQALVRWMLRERQEAIRELGHDKAARERIAQRLRGVASSR